MLWMLLDMGMRSDAEGICGEMGWMNRGLSNGHDFEMDDGW
jgi:hypothetical protein